jgi:hypothetical protein
MAYGNSKWSDVSSLIDNIHEDALFVLRTYNRVVRTVKIFNDSAGFQPRDVNRYGQANVREVAEYEDVVSTAFNPAALATLTPARHADTFLLTDQRVASDRENVREDGAMELGMSFAKYVDDLVCDDFASLTGGTIGSAGGTILFSDLIKARAILENLSVPGPYYATLHPYQISALMVDSLTNNSGELINAPQFQDDLLTETFFNVRGFSDIIVVSSPSVNVDASDDADGAMYGRLALAYDERKGFEIEPQRDASREAFEMNARMWFAHGVYDAGRGIRLIGDAATPS